MTKKQIVKIAIDILMTAGLLLLMSYSLLGEAAHEWIGTAMFVLFVAHHILNNKWWRNLFKGKYKAFRVLQTALVLFVLVCMIGSMASGIVLSSYIFEWIKIRGISSIARTAHMLCAYWGFIFLSLHLGLHWNMIMSMERKLVKKSSNLCRLILRGTALLIAGYGVYAFIKRDFVNYMFLRYHFAFFDFDEPIILFLLDYIAIMGLFVCAGHYLSFFILKIMKKKELYLDTL